MADRLFVEEKVIDLFRNLTLASYTKKPDIKTQPFSELKTTFLWAVSIGLREGKRLPLEGAREGLFRYSNLDREELSFLKIIALADTEDINILTDENEDEVQKIAEEYANEGIRIIHEFLKNGSGDPLWKFVELLDT